MERNLLRVSWSVGAEVSSNACREPSTHAQGPAKVQRHCFCYICRLRLSISKFTSGYAARSLSGARIERLIGSIILLILYFQVTVKGLMDGPLGCGL